MTRIELTKDAERDLIDIYLYGVENFGNIQAERYAETLNVKIAAAAENRSFGTDYAFVRNGLRRYQCVSHAIYYQPTTEGIVVLRILHSRMDPNRPSGVTSSTMRALTEAQLPHLTPAKSGPSFASASSNLSR